MARGPAIQVYRRSAGRASELRRISNKRGSEALAAPKRTKDQLGLDQIGLPRIRDRSAMPNRCPTCGSTAGAILAPDKMVTLEP